MEDNGMSTYGADIRLSAEDREIFERVWQRVMAAGNSAPAQSGPPDGEWKQEPVLTGAAEDVRLLPVGTQVPAQQDVMCFGQGAKIYTEQLREMIDAEMEDFRTYQVLARRAGGNGTRLLSALAADERRHAKRLLTAYFLITGERYQPVGHGTNRCGADLMSGLREQFMHEQRGAAVYQGAAQETADPCLCRLYRELSGEEHTHARAIRSLLEQM